MKRPGPLRRWAPFLLGATGGFSLGYVIVAVFVFPAGAAQRDATVPNVIGMPYAEAAKQLQQEGFVVERGESRFHNAAPRGTVLDQQPPPDRPVVSGVRVTLDVSSGPKLGPVPAIIGLSREQALRALEIAGFDHGQVSERASNEPRGAVIDSRPRPGSLAPMLSPVELVVSAGPTTIAVPDVVGLRVADATQLLRQVGLAVGDIHYMTASAVGDASAMIEGQSPTAGTQVGAGARVDITVRNRP